MNYDIIDINNKLFSILHSDYNENNVNNPSVIGIIYNKNFLIKNFFFSYFQVEDNFGIFEDSKINSFLLVNLKKTNLKSNNLFKNCKNLETIYLGQGYTDDINIIENQNMLLNCENLYFFYLNNCDNKKISFKNLKNLSILNIGKSREINETIIRYNNTSILDNEKFYNCEDLNFNDIYIDLIINKDTTGLDNVFYNSGKNSKTKNKVKITIEEDTVLDEINLDKMFNNSYFTDIEIINKSNKKNTGSEKIFENKNLNVIRITDSSIDNSGRSFGKNLLECKTFEGKLYKDIDGLKFEDYLKDQKTFQRKLTKQICDDEEKKSKEEEKNKKNSVKDINNINNNNTCCTKCLSCCYNCKCC